MGLEINWTDPSKHQVYFPMKNVLLQSIYNHLFANLGKKYLHLRSTTLQYFLQTRHWTMDLYRKFGIELPKLSKKMLVFKTVNV
jgi:hypothetical protein